MLRVFLRHGNAAALIAAVVVEALAFLSGWVNIKPLLVLLGALVFYLSEYGIHRFAFQAPPFAGRVPRRRVQRPASSIPEVRHNRLPGQL